ncbi:g2376 [Coccomyxa elongata]
MIGQYRLPVQDNPKHHPRALGFVGSVTLEQLLRTCPDVRKVILLVRRKKSQSGEQRLEHLLHERPLFRGMWVGGRIPDAVRAKLHVLEGDLSEPDCGLSEHQLAELHAEVDWVIHSAASISFFKHVHTLLDQNYLATKKAAELAEGMPHLRGFLHVSTAYVNAHRPKGSHIEEAIYRLTFSDGQVLAHASLAAELAALPHGKAERKAQGVLQEVGLPNCYTLTKHMAECLLADAHAAGRLRVAIVRPSVVGCIACSPLPGYFGNAAGVPSATLAFASGMARFMCHDPRNVFDCVPCDVVASVVLLSGAALQQGSEKGGPLILHAATSTTNTVRYCDLFMSTVLPYWQSNPPSHRLTSKPYKSIWAKNSYLPEHTLTFKRLRLRQGLRLRAIAAGLRLAGHRIVAQRLMSGWKVWKLYNTSSMDFHLFFCCCNVAELQGMLSDKERTIIKPLWQAPDDEWEKYMLVYMEAIRAKFYPAPQQAAKAEQPADEQQALPAPVKAA